MKRILVVLAVLVGCAKPVTPPAQHHLMAAAGTTLTANQVSFFRGNPDPPTPGSVAIVSTDGISLLQQNSDGTTQAIGGGGSGTVTSVSGTAPIAVATGTTTPVVSIAASTSSVPGSMSAVDKTKINSLPSPWITVSVPIDTTDIVLSNALNGDVDGAYEIDVVGAATTDTSTQYSVNVGVDGGSASATGCTTVTIFGNGTVTGSTAQLRCDFNTASSTTTSENPTGRILFEAARTTLPRTFISFGTRLTTGATTNIAFWETMGNYSPTGNITNLTLHASTAAGFKAGTLARYRVTNAN